MNHWQQQNPRIQSRSNVFGNTRIGELKMGLEWATSMREIILDVVGGREEFFLEGVELGGKYFLFAPLLTS